MFTSTIAIGLTKELPKLDEMPGWSKTYGYHGDDGAIYLNCLESICTYEKYTKGDVVGCGIEDQNGLFFTKNGKKLGEK